MDVQDQITHAHSLPSGHEGHGVHLCHRCGWPFPNPHPSSKQRRSHKRHCGTIEGYPVLSGAEAISDEDHHADTDKEKSPSPTIEKKTSIGASDGLRASISRSEDEFFSDAVTEFAEGGPIQGGSTKKTFEKDLFYSFNDGTNEVLNAPIEVRKVDASVEVTEKPVANAEKIGETEITPLPALSESKLELTETDDNCADGLVKDGAVDPTPEPIPVSLLQEAETIEAVSVNAAEEKVEASQTSEVITEEAKDSEVTKATPDVSLIVGQDDDNIKQEVCEKIESEAVKESEVKHDKIELDHEVAPEVVKESEIEPTVEGVIEEIKIEKIESDRELVPQEESESDQKVPVSIEKEGLGEHIQEVVNKLDTVLTEKSNVDAPESVKCSEEQIQEVVKELGTVLNEKENPDAAEFVKFLNDQVHDAAKEPETVVTEKENFEEPKLKKQSKESTQEVLVDPDSIWTEKTDLDAPIVEKTLKENTPEETVLKSDPVLTEKEDLDGPQLEKCAKENAHEVIEQKVDSESKVVGLVADVTAEKITPNASGVAPEQMSVDSSSRNSLDGNWGSVSVLSTTSVDAESTEKPKVNPTKPATADCPVEPEVKDSKQEPLPEDLTKVNNESEAKKSTPLKNLLGEAKSPSVNKTDSVAKKDEAVNDKEGEPMSPPKLIEDGKKERKKVKGVRSWVPFGCCSSVNVVN